MAPALAPLGFGTWEAASSLITGVIAKEIVVGTMGETYAPAREHAEKTPTLGEDLKHIVTSFGGAVRESIGNVVSTFGISSLSFEEKEDHSALKDAIRGAFTPLTAFGFSSSRTNVPPS